MSLATKFFRNAWNTLVNPTVRLSADFPFGPGGSIKLYAKSLVFFIIGSAIPVCLFLLLLKLVPADSSFLGKLLMAPGAEGLVPVSYTHLDVYKRQEQTDCFPCRS